MIDETKKTETWEKCQLYKEFAKTKRRCLKDIHRRNWRTQQTDQLRQLVDEAFIEVKEAHTSYWIKRLVASFRNRLFSCTKEDWIEIIASFSDSQAYGPYQQEKMKKYCLMVKETARKHTASAQE